MAQFYQFFALLSCLRGGELLLGVLRLSSALLSRLRGGELTIDDPALLVILLSRLRGGELLLKQKIAQQINDLLVKPSVHPSFSGRL